MMREARTEIKHLKFIFFAPAAEPRKRRLVQEKKNNDRKGDSYKEKKQREVDSHLGENSLI